MTIRQVSDVRISPDGARVAFVLKEPADPKKPERERDTNIWVVPADGGAPPRLFAASSRGDTSPRWSPDGRWLAFLSGRGEPEGTDAKPKSQLYLMPTDGGEAEALTAGKGEVTRLEWSRDGSMIAFTVTDPPTEEEEKRRKERDDAIHVDHDVKQSRLWVLRLADRKTDQITKQDFSVNGFDWSPDGAEIAACVSPTPKENDAGYHSRLVVIKRATGEVARTLSDRLADVGCTVAWSPDGKSILFSESTPNGVASWPALAPAAGGPPREILKDYRGTAFRFEWTPDSRALVTEGDEGEAAAGRRGERGAHDARGSLRGCLRGRLQPQPRRPGHRLPRRGGRRAGGGFRPGARAAGAPPDHPQPADRCAAPGGPE
ncbi:MAG TPA: hypothetical protein VFT43_08410 [Candidatus Polarisedimenticolia bacterium]|nr:hypothetical protein [Candidatus Polarisedimenticolia bacterium]